MDGDQGSETQGLKMTKEINELHKPVALERTLEILGGALGETGAGKVLVDCTLGLGGHSEAFLERFSELTLIGIDRDPSALELAGKRLERFGSRAKLVHAVYDEIADVIYELGFPGVDAILLDLGVSSMQLDNDYKGLKN